MTHRDPSTDAHRPGETVDSRGLAARIRRAPLRSLAVAAAVTACLPAAAIAGKRVVSGPASLQLEAAVSPDKPGARGATLHFHIDYESTKPGQRIMADQSEIKLSGPRGQRFNTSAAGVCDTIAFENAKQNPAVCPQSSIVGTGTLTADARPTLANPVSGSVTIYNARGKHNDLLFYGHTSFGNLAYVFIINPDQSLDAQFSRPTGKSLFTLKTIDFSIRNSSTRKPFVQTAPTCGGSWRYSLLIRNYEAPSSITATDDVRCARPASHKRPARHHAAPRRHHAAPRHSASPNFTG